MSTREVTLPEDVESFVDAQLKAGAYTDADSLVAEAVRRLAEDAANEPDIDQLRALVAESLNDPLPSVPADEVWARLQNQAARRTP